VVLLNNSDSDSKEYHQAIVLLTESANRGHAASQNNLGHCYEFGKGVKKDISLALEWYEKSASQNYSASFVNLGYLQLTKQHYQSAFEYFGKASKNGNSIESWYYLGLMHEKGYYVPTNPHLALQYFEKAADGGHEPSSLKVGDCWFSGSGGVPQDYYKAFSIYSKLALNGNYIAANNIAIMHEEGLGVDVDVEAAETWYKISAKHGNSDAMRNDERLSQLLGHRRCLKLNGR